MIEDSQENDYDAAFKIAIKALEAEPSEDTISRQAAIDAFWSLDAELRPSGIDAILNMLKGLPSVQPEPLTDKEQRTFLRAMEREENVCKHVDNVYNSSYEDSLVRTCHEITRKVKGALWT